VDLKLIRELMNMMGVTGTKRLAIKQGEFEIELEREMRGSGHAESAESDNPMKSELDQHRAQVSPSHLDSVKEVEGIYVTSPMVGTFYTAPSPDDPPFVNEGDAVQKGDVICIIEAMKVMNEVKAEESGTITKVMIENGHPVEFGTKLFEIGS